MKWQLACCNIAQENEAGRVFVSAAETLLSSYRMNAMESSAFKILKEKMISRKTDLINAFELRDHSRSGNKLFTISQHIWLYTE